MNILHPPFENKGLKIFDRNGLICTAENPAISAAILLALNTTFPPEAPVRGDLHDAERD